MGVSLDDADDVIRAAIEADARDGGARYGQAAMGSFRGFVAAALAAVRGVPQQMHLGPVSLPLAAVIKINTDLDFSTYSHEIDYYAIQHILGEHSLSAREKARGQIEVTEADVLMIPEILSQSDYLVLGGKNQRQQDVVGYLKQLPTGSILYLEEARTGRRKLAAVTMRKYPATNDALSIAKTVTPYAQSDGGDVAKLVPFPKKARFRQPERGAITFPLAGIERGNTVVELFALPTSRR